MGSDVVLGRYIRWDIVGDGVLLKERGLGMALNVEELVV